MELLFLLGMSILIGWVVFSVFISNVKMAMDHYKMQRYDFMVARIFGALATPLLFVLFWVITLSIIQTGFFISTGVII